MKYKIQRSVETGRAGERKRARYTWGPTTGQQQKVENKAPWEPGSKHALQVMLHESLHCDHGQPDTHMHRDNDRCKIHKTSVHIPAHSNTYFEIGWTGR